MDENVIETTNEVVNELVEAAPAVKSGNTLAGFVAGIIVTAGGYGVYKLIKAKKAKKKLYTVVKGGKNDNFDDDFDDEIDE